MYGELVPMGGGDPIPLLKKTLLVGRREGCDIVLRFSNVSAHHCQLSVDAGYWYVQDKNSRNGVKVNGLRVVEKPKRQRPGLGGQVRRHPKQMLELLGHTATHPSPRLIQKAVVRAIRQVGGVIAK